MDPLKTNPAGEAGPDAANDPLSDLDTASGAIKQKIAGEKRRERPIDDGTPPDPEEAALDAEVSAKILTSKD